MACGVFGNISDADIRATVRTLPKLMARGVSSSGQGTGSNPI